MLNRTLFLGHLHGNELSYPKNVISHVKDFDSLCIKSWRCISRRRNYASLKQQQRHQRDICKGAAIFIFFYFFAWENVTGNKIVLAVPHIVHLMATMYCYLHVSFENIYFVQKKNRFRFFCNI